MSDTVSRELAEQTLAAVRAQFADILRAVPTQHQPTLYGPGVYAAGWTIACHRHLPADWAWRALQPTFDEKAYLWHRAHGVGVDDATAAATTFRHTPPAGVRVTPVNRWCVALHPRETVTVEPDAAFLRYQREMAERKRTMIGQIMGGDPPEDDRDGDPLTGDEIDTLTAAAGGAS